MGKTRPPGESPQFSSIVLAFAGKKGVDPPGRGKGFGSRALRVNGKIFAMMSRKDQFVVKLPPVRARELVLSGQGEFFDPGHGRRMKEWVALLGARTPWIDLAQEAYRFVGGLARGARA
jgi:hypothetical protein